MTDWQGNTRSYSRRQRILLYDVSEDTNNISAITVGSIAFKAIIDFLDGNNGASSVSVYSSIPSDANKVSCAVVTITPFLNGT